MRYGEAVKVVGKTFLLGEGQTLQDYILYMKEPGNELSLHLCTCMCQKQFAVITKTNVYYIGKLNNSCDDFIQISDCDMVPVYLGKDVFCGTKEKHFLHRPEPKKPAPRTRPEMDDEYEPPELPVYDQESQPSKHFTWSMGSAPLAESPPRFMPEPSDTEGASDLSPAPPTKRQGCPRWPKKLMSRKKERFPTLPQIVYPVP